MRHVTGKPSQLWIYNDLVLENGGRFVQTRKGSGQYGDTLTTWGRKHGGVSQLFDLKEFY